MTTVKTLADLSQLRDQARKAMVAREDGAKARVIMSMGTCGIAAGGRAVMAAILDELDAKGVQGVCVTQVGCKGFCDAEPMLDVERPGEGRTTYARVTPEGARQIVAQHIIGGTPVAEYILS